MILPDLSINVELPKCEEPGFIIGYTENSVSLSPHKKARLLKEGYEYEICSVETDCGDVSLGEPRFYKEKELYLYQTDEEWDWAMEEAKGLLDTKIKK